MTISRPTARFEDHVGELQLALEAPTLEELFAEAARVVSRECGAPEGEPGPWERLDLEARDEATLLVDWLNELIGRSEVEGRAYGEAREVRISGAGSPQVRVEAEVRGTPVRSWESALKAATYHGLRFERADGGWRATVLFDV